MPKSAKKSDNINYVKGLAGLTGALARPFEEVLRARGKGVVRGGSALIRPVCPGISLSARELNEIPRWSHVMSRARAKVQSVSIDESNTLRWEPLLSKSRGGGFKMGSTS